MEVLAIIPARGGSRGVPRKNLRLIGGAPLIAYAIAAAQDARRVTRIICSTDDEEIAATAREWGAETPFLRPPELARDDTLDLPVFQHVLQELAKREAYRPALVVQLRPTSPLRRPGQLDEALALIAAAPEATALRSVCPAPATPYKMWSIPPEDGPVYLQPILPAPPGIAEPFNAPRQSLPEVYWQTGAIDITRPGVIEAGSMTGDRILAFPAPPEQSVDIDREADLARAEEELARGGYLRPQRSSVAPPSDPEETNR